MLKNHICMKCAAAMLSILASPFAAGTDEPAVFDEKEYLSRNYLVPLSINYNEHFLGYARFMKAMHDQVSEYYSLAYSSVIATGELPYSLFIVEKLEFRGPNNFYIILVKCKKEITYELLEKYEKAVKGELGEEQEKEVVDEMFRISKISISPQLAKQLSDIWYGELSQVRNSKVDVPEGFDGAEYEFGSFTTKGRITGKQWYCEEIKKNPLTAITDELVALGEKMNEETIRKTIGLISK